jgi:hypothetical protein
LVAVRSTRSLRWQLVMINRNLVFVLGAGVSVPYGFPTGEGLLAEAVEMLTGRNDQRKEVLCGHLKRSPGELQDFARELLESRKQSIDAFVENRPEFLEPGKAVIATLLIPYENRRILTDPPGVKSKNILKETWLDYLFRKMDSDGDFTGNKVSIITFNYDRLVEVYFTQALRASYGDSEVEASARFSKTVPVIHVHGKLGELDSEDGEARAFSPDLDGSILRKAVAGIRILTEVDDEDPVLQSAREKLLQAERVCLLGFGYHPKNIERLGLKELAMRGEVVGSTLGFEPAEVEDITTNRVNLQNSITGGWEALAFLKKNRVLWWKD